ncbi:glutaminase, partial [Bradyrhizobium sp. IC4061]
MPTDDSKNGIIDYVSTGHLPDPDTVVKLVQEAHKRFSTDNKGVVSTVYPALERIPPNLFGVCMVGTNGKVHSAGDVDYEFTIMSVSKPFVFALVCQAIGAKVAREKLGVNSTGMA